MVFEESGFCAFRALATCRVSLEIAEVQPPSSAPLWPRPKRWTVSRVRCVASTSREPPGPGTSALGMRAQSRESEERGGTVAEHKTQRLSSEKANAAHGANDGLRRNSTTYAPLHRLFFALAM